MSCCPNPSFISTLLPKSEKREKGKEEERKKNKNNEKRSEERERKVMSDR